MSISMKARSADTDDSFETSGMKRADRRSSINILVMGDEGVGKSSLISTFVSRYFSEVVPGIMTRVRLPPDPGNSSVTTIVDSQAGDAALISAVAALSQPLQQSRSTPGSASSDSLALMERAETLTPSTMTPQKQKQSMIEQNQKQDQSVGSGSDDSSTIGRSGGSAGIRDIDSIILVYDLDRVETFFRLESHWLPLIERCYNGKVPVIVAENKMDLFRPSSTAGMTDEQALARKRQQIVSLMQRFPFVRQCIKCSAKNLLRVDDVFLKAQQAVLYPLTPLYDLDKGQLTIESRRAFTRIFRMYDRDHDGLLNDTELDRFQRETYHVAVFDRDLAAWKKVVARTAAATAFNQTAAPAVIQDGKFTLEGFLTVFDVFISQNRLDVVWQALRKFGYDDDLNLHIPQSIIQGSKAKMREPIITVGNIAKSWKLSASAKQFVAALFYQFDSDNDGTISAEDIAAIFAILPPLALPPWHPLRSPGLFRKCFSFPKSTTTDAISTAGSRDDEEDPATSSVAQLASTSSLVTGEVPDAGTSQLLSHSGISILSGSDSLPSLGEIDSRRVILTPITFREWMGQWHVVSSVSPDICRAELFRLGHIEENHHASYRKKMRDASLRGALAGRKKSKVSPIPAAMKEKFESTLQSRELRVLVLGSSGSGKTALLNALCCRGGVYPSVTEAISSSAIMTNPTRHPETSSACVKLQRRSNPSTASNVGGVRMRLATSEHEQKDGDEFVTHLVFTDVPEAAVASSLDEFIKKQREFEEHQDQSFGSCFDLVVFVFDCTKPSSFAYVKETEASSCFLNKETPRVFVATKTDLLKHHAIIADSSSISSIEESQESYGTSATTSAAASVLEAAKNHCCELDLEPPLLASAAELCSSSTSSSAGPEKQRTAALVHLARCALLDEPGVERLKSRPHEEQKRREAANRRRKMVWLGGCIVSVVVVAVGVGLLWGTSGKSSSSGKSSGNSPKSIGWLRRWFASGSTTRETTVAANASF